MIHWDSPAALPDFFTLPELKTKKAKTLAGKAIQSKLHNIIQYIHNDIHWDSPAGLALVLHVIDHTVTDLALFDWDLISQTFSHS
eukprot:scaffold59470_cov36-Cyclotella_meneghiniana.AAC.2